jgi:hypothetical protein
MVKVSHILSLNLLIEKRILLVKRLNLSLRLLLIHRIIATKLTLRELDHWSRHRCRRQHRVPGQIQLLGWLRWPVSRVPLEGKHGREEKSGK